MSTTLHHTVYGPVFVTVSGFMSTVHQVQIGNRLFSVLKPVQTTPERSSSTDQEESKEVRVQKAYWVRLHPTPSWSRWCAPVHTSNLDPELFQRTLFLLDSTREQSESF